MSACGTSGILENGCFRAHPSGMLAAAMLFLLLIAQPAWALKVRVGSGSRIEAHAGLMSRDRSRPRVVVRGVLRDDAGAGLPNEHIALTFRGADSRPLRVPVPEPCTGATAGEHEPHVAPDEYVVDTDSAGAFCVQADVPGTARIELRFAGSGLLEATRADVPVGSGPTPSLVFEPPIAVVHLDDESAEVSAKLTNVDGPARGWALRLHDERGEDLGVAIVRDDRSARWSVPTRRFANPGPGELTASLEGPDAPPLSTRQRIERRARVALDILEAPPRLQYREGQTVSLRVHSSRGPVPGGFVEARTAQHTITTVPVSRGHASWTVTDLAQVDARDVELRYWPDAPWWEPGQARTVHLIGGHVVPWVRGTLIGLALLVAAWMTRGSFQLAVPKWLRRSAPAVDRRRVATPGASSHAPQEIGVVRVSDAHDGQVLPGALVEVTVAAFPPARASGAPGIHASDATALPEHALVVWSQFAGPDGAVRLPPNALPPDALLRVSSPLHVPASLPVPRSTDVTVQLTARRRHLLERLLQWAARELGTWVARRDPTPREVAQRARSGQATSAGVDAWTGAVENAVFGAAPVDERAESAVLALEPSSARALEPQEPASVRAVDRPK